MKLKNVFLVLILWFLADNITSFAQDIDEPYSIQRISGEVKIDGEVNETAWESIIPLPLTMHWPSYKGEITEPTEIRIAYDDQYLYLSSINYDSEPSKIQDITFTRDEISQKIDNVVLMLDPYNDNENTLLFSVSPTGSRADLTIKNDAQGSGFFSTSWNSYWIAESKINNDGWQMEMRIPFSSLRFQINDNEVNMGLGVYRYVARKREMTMFPAIAPEWGFWSFAKASQMQTVKFKNIQNKRPWYTSPYILLGTGHHHQENTQGDYTSVNDNNYQVGLDVQHAFSDNLNADFTINTDFAQVEADAQAINLSRFSLFFPEKRRFFLERASTFDFTYDLNNNMFYSRKIGIQDGEMVPLYGGVRLVGRVNKWDLGLINIQSRAVNGLLSENFGVVRVRRNIINSRSYAGAMFTSRIDTDGNKNFTYGGDAIINVFDQDYLQVNLAQTSISNDTTNASGFNRSRMYLMWENRIQNGFGYKFSYSRVGNNYDPGVGFEQRFNFSQFGDNVFYTWFAPEESQLRQTTITLLANISFNNTTSDLETYTYGISTRWDWDRNASLNLTLSNFYDNVPSDFNLSDDIIITATEYTNTTGSLSYITAPVGLYIMGFGGQVGTFYGGNLISANISPEIVFSKYFQVSAYYQYTTIDFSNSNDLFVSHLGRLNLGGAINIKWSMSAFVQYNSLQNLGSVNYRLRWNPVDGNDLYIVYNETLNTNPDIETPILPVSDSRAILVKYIHTFKF